MGKYVPAINYDLDGDGSSQGQELLNRKDILL